MIALFCHFSFTTVNIIITVAVAIHYTCKLEDALLHRRAMAQLKDLLLPLLYQNSLLSLIIHLGFFAYCHED